MGFPGGGSPGGSGSSGARGRLYAGTSGFSYADWAPRFYPAGTRGDALLATYAGRLDAVELNNTFYQHPTEARIAAWLAATPAEFRFVVKAQKGGSFRAFRADPSATIEWLLRPYRLFGERLGSVLFRVPGDVARGDARLDALLAAWPHDVPLTVELQHGSWLDDEVLARVAAAGAAWCSTDLDELAAPPRLFRTGPFLYLRLRRTTAYDERQLAAWADRLAPFLEDGVDAYVFFRHDAVGEAALAAERLAGLVRERVTAG